jgi:putative acetyltransferase
MTEPVLEYGFQERDRGRIVALLRDYEASIGVSLRFQEIDAELAGLPGDYSPPRGALVLAREAGGPELVGCVAVRAVPGSPELCEMKRLFVRPSGQGRGLGRKLAMAAMSEARRLGYERMCLDTLPHLTAAQSLYRDLGFCHTGVTTTEPVVLQFECTLSAEP